MGIIGTLVHQYRVEAKLGEGGMGEVYLAHDERAQRRVALKFLSRSAAAQAEARLRLEREARAAAALDSAHIVDVYEVGEFDGRPFFAMPFVEGEVVSELCTQAPLPVDRALDIARQAASGLHRAHEAGIVHRDIKPANLVVDRHGCVKILDFGLAISDTQTRLTVDQGLVGTAHYMSPEQARNDPLDHRTDIFSLGAVLYELLTGRPPFTGDRPATVLYAIETATPPAPSTLEPEVPAAVDRIVLAMLAKEPDRRPATAAAVCAALADPSRARLGPATGRLRPRFRVPAGGAVAAAAAAMVVTLAAVAWLLNGRQDTPGEGRVMVAVLPFENLGVAEDEYLADGVTDEIIGRLVAVPGLGVISRTSSRRYKGTDKPTATIGRELGVAYLLQGTIRWGGGATGTVRVTPELIRVADDTQLWAQHYDRGVDDLFQIQTEIAGRVAAALNLSLLASTRREMAARPTGSFEAYRAYQRGRVAARNAPYSTESLALAVALFERAVDLDPDFALAHAMLARMHAQAYHAGHDRTTVRLARAEASAGRALELAPELPETRLAHAYYRYWGLHDYDAALAELDSIPDHRTGNAEVLAARGYILRRQGRAREAAGSLRRALELDPRNDVLAVELANTYLGMWRFDRAETFYDLAISLAPDAAAPYTLKVRNRLLWTGDLQATRAILDGMPAGHEIRHLYFLAFQALCEGDHARVVQLLWPRREEIYETHAQAVPLALVLAWAHERSGDPAAARQAYRLAGEQLTATVDRRPDDFRIVMALGLVSAGLGDREAARRHGERALALNPVANDAWSSPIMQRNLLILQAASGDVEAALATLSTLLAAPNPGLSPALARLEPRLDGLREDPRFELVVARAEAAHPIP